MKLESVNPSNYQSVGSVTISTLEKIKDKVARANVAKTVWKNRSICERIRLLRPIFEEFGKRKDELARLESKEMGMPIGDALDDVDDALAYVNWYFDHAEEFLNPETTVDSEEKTHTVYYEPIGVIAAILPWNFPFFLFVWGTVQGLIAGNVVVMKHSEYCPLVGKLIEDVFSNHNLPEGVFQEVYGDGEVGRQLVHQPVHLIQFTGSTTTGMYLYEVASKRFIKANLELGGSAPGIIFEDANLEKAVMSVCGLRLFNSGQCCDGLKRLIVHETLFDRVQEMLADLFVQKKIGDALDRSTEIGPLVSEKQLERLKAQVMDAMEKGAKVIAGGVSLEDEMNGAFFPPTLLIDISKEMRVWKEEVFGPVLPMVPFSTEEEAIALANDTPYGLGAYLYTEDQERALRVAGAIEAGEVSVNGCGYYAPETPFGGYKASGFSRVSGKQGFHAVTQVKVIARKPS